MFKLKLFLIASSVALLSNNAEAAEDAQIHLNVDTSGDIVVFKSAGDITPPIFKICNTSFEGEELVVLLKGESARAEQEAVLPDGRCGFFAGALQIALSRSDNADPDSALSAVITYMPD